jgi:murein DD-endopeptidase MepM/ murein hydrolase activator NlpD
MCGALAVAAVLMLAMGPTSCASPRPSASVLHVVARGENLYRIGLRYGVPADEIARANGIRDVTELSVGTRLRVPNGRLRRGAPPASAPRGSDIASSRRLARVEAQRRGNLRFEWPVKGRLTSPFGKRWGRPHEGIDLAAKRGTVIHAAEEGSVIHSGRLGDYGKVVIVRHDGDYRSVYAHARRTHVRRGDRVRKGQKIAEVGTTGKSTGPHLHFEIRQRQTPQDPMLYLP